MKKLNWDENCFGMKSRLGWNVRKIELERIWGDFFELDESEIQDEIVWVENQNYCRIGMKIGLGIKMSCVITTKLA